MYDHMMQIAEREKQKRAEDKARKQAEQEMVQ